MWPRHCRLHLHQHLKKIFSLTACLVTSRKCVTNKKLKNTQIVNLFELILLTMQGTCLKTEWCTRNYIFMLILFTFDPCEVAWISFGPKNAACSQNSLDSGWPLHPCSMVSMPCALDQAPVVHDPFHRWVSCFTIAFNDGRKCVTLHSIRCSGGWSLWRQISNDVGQHISTSVVEYHSTSFRAP